MSNGGTGDTANLTLEQTNDIAMTIDDVLKDQEKMVKIITGDNAQRNLLLRELMMNVYIRGFFSGVHNKMIDDQEKTQTRQ